MKGNTETMFDAATGKGFTFDRYGGTYKYGGFDGDDHVFKPVVGESDRTLRLSDSRVMLEIENDRMEPNGRSYPVNNRDYTDSRRFDAV